MVIGAEREWGVEGLDAVCGWVQEREHRDNRSQVRVLTIVCLVPIKAGRAAFFSGAPFHDKIWYVTG